MRILTVTCFLIGVTPAAVSAQVVMVPSSQQTHTIEERAWQALADRVGPDAHMGTRYVTYDRGVYFVCGAGYTTEDKKFAFVYMDFKEESKKTAVISTIDRDAFKQGDALVCHPH